MYNRQCEENNYYEMTPNFSCMESSCNSSEFIHRKLLTKPVLVNSIQDGTLYLSEVTSLKGGLVGYEVEIPNVLLNDLNELLTTLTESGACSTNITRIDYSRYLFEEYKDAELVFNNLHSEWVIMPLEEFNERLGNGTPQC